MSAMSTERRKSGEITDNDLEVLRFLDKNGPQTWTELHEGTTLTHSTLSRRLEILQAKGVIVKKRRKYSIPRDKDELEMYARERMPEELEDYPLEKVLDVKDEHSETLKPTIREMKEYLSSAPFDPNPVQLGPVSSFELSKQEMLERLTVRTGLEDTWELEHLEEKHDSELVGKWRTLTHEKLPNVYELSRDLVDKLGSLIAKYINEEASYLPPFPSRNRPLEYTSTGRGIRPGYPIAFVRTFARAELKDRTDLIESFRWNKGKLEAAGGDEKAGSPRDFKYRIPSPEKNTSSLTAAHVAVDTQFPRTIEKVREKLDLGKELIYSLRSNEIGIEIREFLEKAEKVAEEKNEVEKKLREIEAVGPPHPYCDVVKKKLK